MRRGETKSPERIWSVGMGENEGGREGRGVKEREEENMREQEGHYHIFLR